MTDTREQQNPDCHEYDPSRRDGWCRKIFRGIPCDLDAEARPHLLWDSKHQPEPTKPDIVERFRDFARVADDMRVSEAIYTFHTAEGLFELSKTDLREAADEIEKLRAENERLSSRIPKIVHGDDNE